MDIHDIIDLLYHEHVLEGIGFLFGFRLLWQLFFEQGIVPLITLFITSVC